MPEIRKALVVGIDNYPGNNRLNGCCNDARAIAERLKVHGTGEPNFEVECLIDTQQGNSIVEKLNQCFSQYADVALFYFSGHGNITSAGGVLMAPDSTASCGAVSMQDLLTIVNQSLCRDKIVVLDCCYSGSMGNALAGTNDNIAVIHDGVSILTASRSNETAVESAATGHGLFSSLLLDALDGQAADLAGHITAGGIYSYVDKAMGWWGQRPVFKTNVSKFTSIRNIAPQVDIALIRELSEMFESEQTEFSLDPSYEYTNKPDYPHEVKVPYANDDHVEVFKKLQLLEGAGLVQPVGEEHMYFAAMNSKACRLTPLGQFYWGLAKNNRI